MVVEGKRPPEEVPVSGGSFDYASDEHLDGLSRDALYAEIRFNHRSCKDLESENAKLRELVDAWMGCGTRYHTMKGCCPMFDARERDFCKAGRLAMELGIEVDG